MGYSLNTASSSRVGPVTGGNSSSGGVNVGGNPNLQTAVQSATSLLSNPLSLVIVGVIVVAGIYFYMRAKK